MSDQTKLDLNALKANSNLRARAHWIKRFAGFEWKNYLKSNTSLKIDCQSGLKIVEIRATEAQCNINASKNLSPKAKLIVFSGVLAVLLHKLSKENDMVIFVRSDKVDKLNDGFMPLRIRGIVSCSFNGFIENVKSDLLQDLAFADYPLQYILPDYSLKSKYIARIIIEIDAPIRVAAMDVAKNDIIFSIKTKDQLSLSIHYREGGFNCEYLTGVGKFFWSLFESALSNPNKAIDELSLLTAHTISSIQQELQAVSKHKRIRPAYHQERLWFIDEFESGYLYKSRPIYHNLPLILHFNTLIDHATMHRALLHLLQAHDVFFNRLEMVESTLKVKVGKDRNFLLREFPTDLADLKKRITTEVNKPFSAKGALFRTSLFHVDSNNSVLVLVMHHSIADRFTINYLADQITVAYDNLLNGTALNNENLKAATFYDFTFWQQRATLQIEHGLLHQWEKMFGKKLKALEFPLSRPRAAIHIYEADNAFLKIPNDVFLNINKFSTIYNISLHVFFMGAFNILLQKYVRHNEVVVGTSVDNRDHPALKSTLGPVSNLLVVNSMVEQNDGVVAYLQELGVLYTNCLNNQLIPFDRLVTLYAPDKDMSRTALFDVLFQYENAPASFNGSKGLKVRVEETGLGLGKYDLNFLIKNDDGNVQGILVYNKLYIDSQVVVDLLAQYLQLIQNIIANPAGKIGQLRLTDEKQNMELLAALKNEKVSYPKSKSIIDLFVEQANKTPFNVAIDFKNEELTYQQVDQLSSKVASSLLNNGLAGNEIVGIMAGRSANSVIAMLGVLKAGGAYLPIDEDYPIARVNFIINDSGIRFLLVNELAVDFADKKISCLSLKDIFNTDSVLVSNISVCKPSDLCYIIYTSGTTGHPKGVMITHKNVVRLMFNDCSLFNFNEDDTWTMFHSHSFDFSVWEMFGALLTGGKLVIIPKDIARDTVLFYKLLREKRVTILNQTPSAFTNLISQDLISGPVDLPVRMVILGGEALKPSKLKPWFERYPSVRLINMFGITETTVHVTFKEIGAFEINNDISSIGKPIPTMSVYLLDDYLNPVPAGVVGEIYVAGEGLAKGYLNRKELTNERFIKNPFSKNRKLYKSGDLAKIDRNGELVYLGRKDEQVQLRGFRIELAEISRTLERDPGVKEAHVRLWHNKGDDYLIAYYTGIAETAELKAVVINQLPDYMHPSYYIKLELFPLTLNGKLAQNELPEPELKATHADEQPEGELEQTLAGIWSTVLQLDKALIGATKSFFELGGNSLKAVSLINQVRKIIGAELILKEIFLEPTIRALALLLTGRNDEFGTRDIPLADIKPYYPLSSAQKRMYLLHQFNKSSLAYNMPNIFSIKGKVDRVRLKVAFQALLNHHDILRTNFERLGDNVVQIIGPECLTFQINEMAAEVSKIDGCINSMIRPFDLGSDRLFRAGLISVNSGEELLVIDMHHIVSDGISQQILIRDFMQFYMGKMINKPVLQYKDYAEWQQRKNNEIAKKWWLNQFADEVPVLQLPLDFVRPLVKDYKGDSLSFTLDENDTLKVKTLATATNSTVFIVLLTCWNILLNRISGQEDVITGTPTGGREHAGLQDMVGIFVNTVALRSSVNGTYSMQTYLEELTRISLEAFSHQSYQYEELVDALKLERDTARNPLFDVMFVFQNYEIGNLSVPDLDLTGYSQPHTISKFDLLLNCREYKNKMCFELEYASSLFKAESISRYAGYFQQIVKSIISNPRTLINEVRIVPDTELEMIVQSYNQTTKTYAHDNNVIKMFRAQARKHPMAVAVSYANQKLTYKELDELSCKFAAYLLEEKKVKKGELVGLLLDREVQLIPAIYGILKAGCAYVPIDPHYPTDRIAMVLEDSEVRIIITRGKYIKEGIAGKADYLDLDSELTGIISMKKRPSVKIADTDLAYVIYTSGSTGKPKGVMIEHHSVVNRLLWMQAEYPLNGKDVLLQKTPIVFDVSVWELFWWALAGASLYVLKHGEEKDAEVLQDVIFREQITTIHFVPSMLSHFLQTLEQDKEYHKLQSLRLVFASGESLKYGHALAFGRQINSLYGTRLINLYGPTEATVDVSYYACDFTKELPQSIPIGKPIHNTRLYILDKYGRICPIGTTGELCIAGVGLARGYINNIELTAEKFTTGGEKDVQERLYHTGDLARWLMDGNIEYIGRMDSQIKLHGLRIELEDIQVHLTNYQGIADSVVILKGQSPDQVLVAYYLSNEEIPAIDLRRHLESRLPVYMIPGYFIQLEAWPFTTNGKLNKKALPDPESIDNTNYTAPTGETEMLLASLWAEVLKLDPNHIGIHQSFFELGGNSLRAMALISKIVKRLRVKLSLQQAFTHDTIHKLAKIIDNTSKTSYVSIERAIEKPYYAITPIQKSLYFLNEYDTEFLAYNMPRIVKIEGALNSIKLINVIKTLFERHEIFRTAFVLVDKEPVQVVHKDVNFEVQVYKALSYEETQHHLINMIKPFDLTKPPLMRAGLVEVGDHEHYLMIDIHHIVFDGISSGILINEFAALYNGEILPELPLQYKDYADWLNSFDQQAVRKMQRKFWRNEFSNGVPVLNLPTDYARPLVRSHEGKTLDFDLNSNESKAVKKLAEKQGTTLFMVLLSAYYILLSKITGQDDIVIGTTTAGRNHNDLQQMLGMFLSSIPLRNSPQASLHYDEFLKKVKNKTLECFEIQGFDFDMTLDFNDVQRDMSQNALFNVLFMLHNLERTPVSIRDLNFTTINWENVSSKFDLTLTANETGDIVKLNFEYCTKLFKKETIGRYAVWFKNIIKQITGKYDIQISQINLMSEAEELQILNEFNAPEGEFNVQDNVIKKFNSQVGETPTAVALKFGQQTFTYKELQDQANKLAHYLLASVPASKGIVALYLNRSPEMIIAMLAVLKTGSAFVCIDPEKTPAERVKLILKESNAKSIIINSAVDSKVHTDIITVNLASTSEYSTMPVTDPKQHIALDDLAYVIFTSGSAGVPKGVMIEHKALADYVSTFSEYFGVKCHDRIIQMSAFTFDTSIEEIFPALTTGACIIMLTENDFTIGDLSELIRDERISILSTTPLILNELNRKCDYLNSLRAIISGGDILKASYISNLLGICQVYNTYGPSEATVCVTYHKIDDLNDAHLIGKPIANKQVLILDEHHNLVPIGLQGEICVSGIGLARGYLQDESLTQRKFPENPVTGKRMYSTGDRGKWRADGSIEFAGRKDDQIKIRGIRIEPGEIEASLGSYPLIKDVVVKAKQNKQQKYLVAYYVADQEISDVNLRSYLTAFLPDYMIPQFFIHLTILKRNSSGKMDTNTLPEPEFSLLHIYKGPETVTEAALVRIWGKLLSINEAEIGVETSFFHIGGHSLSAMSFVTEVYEALNVKVPLKEFFINPVIRATASFIDAEKSVVNLDQVQSSVD